MNDRVNKAAIALPTGPVIRALSAEIRDLY